VRSLPVRVVKRDLWTVERRGGREESESDRYKKREIESSTVQRVLICLRYCGSSGSTAFQLLYYLPSTLYSDQRSGAQQSSTRAIPYDLTALLFTFIPLGASEPHRGNNEATLIEKAVFDSPRIHPRVSHAAFCIVKCLACSICG
jgi:hypothetical protein